MSEDKREELLKGINTNFEATSQALLAVTTQSWKLKNLVSIEELENLERASQIYKEAAQDLQSTFDTYTAKELPA